MALPLVFGVSLSTIGAVVHQQPTVAQSSEPHIVGLIVLCLVQTLLIVRLLWQREKIDAPSMESSDGAEQALRESEARFRLVANDAPVLIWMADTSGLCTYFNKPWLDFTGRSLVSELGNGWVHGVHAEDLEECLTTYSRAFDQRESFRMEYRLRRYDGEYRWILDIGVPRFNDDGSFAGYIGSAIDVSAQRLAQETLDRLSGKLIEAQENERSRIARELHDDICQRLAILSLEIEHSVRNLDVTPAQSERLQEVWEHCSEIAGDVQAFSHELHSSILDHLGMIAAVRNFTSEFSRKQGVVVEFTHKDIPNSLPQEVSLCLFRVVQEALHNAVKHSGVSYFQVHLQGTPDGIDLEVRDAGVGFDVEKAQKNGGLGLISMQERIHLLKGKFAVDSKADLGTTVRASVPSVRDFSVAAHSVSLYEASANDGRFGDRDLGTIRARAC